MTNEEEDDDILGDLDIPFVDVLNDFKEQDKQVEDKGSEKQNHRGVKLLGQSLLKEELITQEQLDLALARQRESWLEDKDCFLGQILIDMGVIEEQKLERHLIKQGHVPHLNILFYEIDREVIELVSKEVCEEYLLLPLDRLGKILTVAMVNPLNTVALEAVKKACPNLHIRPVMCTWRNFKIVFDRRFKESDSKEAVFGGK